MTVSLDEKEIWPLPLRELSQLKSAVPWRPAAQWLTTRESQTKDKRKKSRLIPPRA